MKKYIKFLKAFVLTCLICLSVLSFWYQEPQKPIKKIKIFFEVYATSPVLWESVELIKSPADELKIFFFHRYPQRSKYLDLKKMNAIEPYLDAGEGLWPYSSARFIQEVKNILKKHPENIPIEIYSNLNQTRYFLMPLLFEIDSKRISRLHLYEDGACNIVASDYNAYKEAQLSPKIVENIIETKGHPTIGTVADWKIALSQLAPTTYHLCHANDIKQDAAFKNLVNYIGEKNIVLTDLATERKRLTGRERKKLAQFFNIDLNTFKKTSFFEKTIVVTTSFLFGNEKAIHNEMMNLLPLTAFNARIFLKCHPSYSAKKECEMLKQAFPQWEMLNPQTPVEAFFLLGVEPDYVGGFSSSLYFLIPPEKILFLLGGHYLSAIKRLNIIDESKQRVPNYF